MQLLGDTIEQIVVQRDIKIQMHSKLLLIERWQM